MFEVLFGRMKNCGAPSFVVYSIGCLHTNWLTTNILSSLEDEAASLNFSNEPTIFLHTGFSSNKIVVGILKRYCCFLLCFLLHSLPRCFLTVKESRSGHPLQLYLHTLCYWLEDGHWLRPLANIYTWICNKLWLFKPLLVSGFTPIWTNPMCRKLCPLALCFWIAEGDNK